MKNIDEMRQRIEVREQVTNFGEAMLQALHDRTVSRKSTIVKLAVKHGLAKVSAVGKFQRVQS